MSVLLIPFGLSPDGSRVVEPEDAARGRNCNSICPGCFAPLISRHPKKNRAHFAHDSKHPDAKPELECQFSSAVAVAMMVRELSKELGGREFLTPEFLCEYCFSCCGKTEKMFVTHERCLTITSSVREPTFAGLTFDLELGFNDARIYVDLFYKGKPRRKIDADETFSEKKVGVVAIDCDGFNQIVLNENIKLRFSDAVLSFLLISGCRSWSFHPRRSSIITKLASKHRCSPIFPLGNKSDVQMSCPMIFQCRQCYNLWEQISAGAPVCKNCHTHLFSVCVR